MPWKSALECMLYQFKIAMVIFFFYLLFWLLVKGTGGGWKELAADNVAVAHPMIAA